MAPRYVMRYKAAHNLIAPKVNVLDALASRIDALGPIATRRARGRAWLQDATAEIAIPKRYRSPSLIFTSPPYLGVMKYAKMNWLRMWLLRQTSSSVDDRLFASGSLPKYLAFMTAVMRQLDSVLAKNGRICLVIGDVKVRDHVTNLAQAVADSCVGRDGLRVDAIVNDPLPVRHKVSRIWGDRRGQATTVDRILILSRAGTTRLPRVPNIAWNTSSKPRRLTGG
jgi:site-specific DNA-methyltransferase (adenine-specific)